MKKAYISPVTSLLMSLSLVVGIFVAGLTNSHVLPAANAQTVQEVTLAPPDGKLVGSVIAAQGIIVNGVATTALIPGSVRFSNTVVHSGCGITALGSSSAGDTVYALGVFTSGNLTGVFTSGNVAGGDGTNGLTGVFTSGNVANEDDMNGVFTSGNVANEDEMNGVFTSGNVANEDDMNGVFTSGNIYVGDGLQIIGGVLTGNNIQIVDGVISGSNLQVTGGYVKSACGN